MHKILGAISLMTIIGCTGGVNSDVHAKHVNQLNAKVVLTAGGEIQTMQEALLDAKLAISPFYQDAKSMAVELTVTNSNSVGVDLQFNSGMQADLWLLDPKGQKVWAWSDDMMFTQAIKQIRIGAGKSFKSQFNVPSAILAGVNKPGFTLQPKFKGLASESRLPVINAISVELLLAD
ncbi:BsuPI-related putative proteinase inhibitor [Shewanella sp. OMA3-2]|uniref:BsuPI-related putative proteinase inhibitor n=1 Tax=Shewanella sp. OMA3-2 TaxID=2908650 RepID=UPI001F3D6E68|nr:BsuPI-related putative proteinase inhibitor [Shewanella sp. OMA3-2]UJF20733.1 BsuPI-related putative proteinase inhibitor [Shewanella sp. OMA3-2]